MATQGMITILDETGKVKFKIICGSDGYNVEKIPKKKLLQATTPKDLYDLALEYECGCEESLVVSYVDDQNRVQHYHFADDLDHEYNPWYWDQFFIADFNPRWKLGSTDYHREVQL